MKNITLQLINLSATMESYKQRAENSSVHPITRDRALANYLNAKQRMDVLLAKAIANGDIAAPPCQQGIRSIGDGSHNGSHCI